MVRGAKGPELPQTPADSQGMLKILFVIQLLSADGNRETGGEQCVTADPQPPEGSVTETSETQILMFGGKSERHITLRHASKVSLSPPARGSGVRCDGPAGNGQAGSTSRSAGTVARGIRPSGSHSCSTRATAGLPTTHQVTSSREK